MGPGGAVRRGFRGVSARIHRLASVDNFSGNEEEPSELRWWEFLRLPARTMTRLFRDAIFPCRRPCHGTPRRDRRRRPGQDRNLTEGTPRVTAIHPVNGSGLDETALLALTAAAEHPSEHPLAVQTPPRSALVRTPPRRATAVGSPWAAQGLGVKCPAQRRPYGVVTRTLVHIPGPGRRGAGRVDLPVPFQRFPGAGSVQRPPADEPPQLGRQSCAGSKLARRPPGDIEEWSVQRSAGQLDVVASWHRARVWVVMIPPVDPPSHDLFVHVRSLPTATDTAGEPSLPAGRLTG